MTLQLPDDTISIRLLHISISLGLQGMEVFSHISPILADLSINLNLPLCLRYNHWIFGLCQDKQQSKQWPITLQKIDIKINIDGGRKGRVQGFLRNICWTYRIKKAQMIPFSKKAWSLTFLCYGQDTGLINSFIVFSSCVLMVWRRLPSCGKASEWPSRQTARFKD